MDILITIVTGLFLFTLGAWFNKSVIDIIKRKNDSKRIDSINLAFNEVLENLKLGNTKFKSRFGNVSYISTYMKDHGSVDIVYLHENNEVSIFKENKCLFTQTEADKKTINNIINEIQKKHGNELNNVVNFFGILFNKTKLEQSLGVKWEEFTATMNKVLEMSKNDIVIDNEAFNHKMDLDIDDILDKIGRFGINSLTIEERKYLDDYSRS